MNLQRTLRSSGIPGLEKLAISHSRHAKYPNLVLFKYDQIDSPMSNAIVQDARGTILDENDDWRIVAFPFRKFFNIGEGNATQIKWDAGVKVMEKLDGSLMILYFYQGEWHVATSGKPDASGKCYQASRHSYKDLYEEQGQETVEDNAGEDALGTSATADVTFADVFWRIWAHLDYPKPDKYDETKCFMFELISPSNRVVCVYEQEGIYLHGVRDLQTMKEMAPEPFAQKYGWQTPSFTIHHSLPDVVEASKKLNAVRSEGFVVVDAEFNRIKIKSPVYVQIALLRTKDPENMNDKRMLSIIQMGESEEFLAYFPQWNQQFKQVSSVFNRLVDKLHTAFDTIKDLKYPKDFVAAVQKCPKWQQSLLFLLKKGSCKTARECLSKHKDIYELYLEEKKVHPKVVAQLP